MRFFFAWVEESETVFSPVSHAREDEKVFSFALVQEEGGFPTLSLEMRIPAGGLLATGRPRHLWFSVEIEGEVRPLFFGRLAGFPRGLAGEVATVELIGQFPGWEAAKAAAFAAISAPPEFDIAFIPAADRENPDAALEARSARWHFDRLTGQVSLSGILAGREHLDLGGGFFRDSLRFDLAGKALKRVDVEAEAEWEQVIRGISAEPGRAIREAFGLHGVTTLTPDSFRAAWPRAGGSIGGTGYQVVASGLIPSDRHASAPRSVAYRVKLSEADRKRRLRLLGKGERQPEVTIPRARFVPELQVAYEFRQRRREVVKFSLSADMPDLAFDQDGGAEALRLKTEDLVGNGLMPESSSSYFLTDRGLESVRHLLSRARARLAAAARAVEISVEAPFSSGLDLSCDHDVTLADPRLPSGTARGKVKRYALVADGERGTAHAEITVACSIGRGGAVSLASGQPAWGGLDYAGGDWQVVTGGDLAGPDGDLAFVDYRDQVPADPPLLEAMKAGRIVQSVSVSAPPEAQNEHLLARQAPIEDDAAKSLPRTEVNLALAPLFSGGTAEHEIAVEISQAWKAPTGIDLEAA